MNIWPIIHPKRIKRSVYATWSYNLFTFEGGVQKEYYDQGGGALRFWINGECRFMALGKECWGKELKL